MRKIDEIKRLVDGQGYPTGEFLEFLEEYEPDKSLPLYEFLEDYLEHMWRNGGRIKLGRRYRGRRKLELHTGGWSGNESIIAALEKNEILMELYMRPVKWFAGGHYYYEIFDGR